MCVLGFLLWVLWVLFILCLRRCGSLRVRLVFYWIRLSSFIGDLSSWVEISLLFVRRILIMFWIWSLILFDLKLFVFFLIIGICVRDLVVWLMRLILRIFWLLCFIFGLLILLWMRNRWSCFGRRSWDFCFICMIWIVMVVLFWKNIEMWLRSCCWEIFILRRSLFVLLLMGLWWRWLVCVWGRWSLIRCMRGLFLRIFWRFGRGLILRLRCMFVFLIWKLWFFVIDLLLFLWRNCIL